MRLGKAEPLFGAIWGFETFYVFLLFCIFSRTGEVWSPISSGDGWAIHLGQAGAGNLVGRIMNKGRAVW